MDTIGRRPWNEVDARLRLEHAKRDIEREGVARPAAIAVGRDHGDLCQRAERFAQAANTRRAEAVVVTDQDSHGVIVRMRGTGAPERRVTILVILLKVAAGET